MSETAAKALINQEKQTLYELIASQKILTATGAEALATIETALGGGGGGGSITDPIDIVDGSVTEDVRAISTAGDYIFNNYFYLYLKVINGNNDSVILKKTGNETGVPLTTNEYINLEPIPGRKHGSLTLTIASGGSVRIIGGF